MAIVAVLLAMATLLGHRAHTEEGLLQGKIVDEWNFYQAKHSRAHEYGVIAEVAAYCPMERCGAKGLQEIAGRRMWNPPEHGCSSPARDSTVLMPLLAPSQPAENATETKASQEAPQKKVRQRSRIKKVPTRKSSTETKLPATNLEL